jgi:hypothetical protein
MFGRRFSSERLRAKLLELLKEPDREYTLENLYLRVQPRPAPEQLSIILDQLRQQGAVRRIYRVVSPTSHIGIGDYASFDEIPDRLFDRTADREIQVEPENIRPIFKTA